MAGHKDPRALMDEWEGAAPPQPQQFMKMLFESELFSPIQLQYITALMKKPGMQPPATPEAGMGVAPANPGVATPPGPGIAPATSQTPLGGPQGIPGGIK